MSGTVGLWRVRMGRFLEAGKFAWVGGGEAEPDPVSPRGAAPCGREAAFGGGELAPPPPRVMRRFMRQLIVVLSLAVAVTGGALAQSTPSVNNVVIVDPTSGDTFGAGDTISVQVNFNEELDVTGTPRLALTIGTGTRYASYDDGPSRPGGIAGLYFLIFSYTVAPGDVDADGISVPGPIDLNGGTIKSRCPPTSIQDPDNPGNTIIDQDPECLEAAVDASLALGDHAITTSSGHKVDAPSDITGVSIISNPASGGTYAAGEVIEVSVNYDRALKVTGTPQLPLTVGTATKQADYDADLSTPGGGFVRVYTLVFSYTVAPGDSDTDGISVPGPIGLNGGSIQSRCGMVSQDDPDNPGNTILVPDPSCTPEDMDLVFGGNAVANSADHKVDGGVALDPPLAPDLSGVTVSGSGQTLSFQWASQATDAARAPVTGYRVEWSADGSTGWTAITPNLGAPANPGTTRVVFTEMNVPHGTTRHYRVFALSLSGDSAASATVSGAVPADAGGTPTQPRQPPGQVRGVTVTPGVEQLAVQWTEVMGATGYRVQWKSGSESYDTTRQATATGTSHTITGLTAGTSYTVRVAATNSAGVGLASAEETGEPRAMNNPPVANDDPDATTPEDPDTALAIDVLANDTDADNDPLVVASVTQPANGRVRIDDDRRGVTYAPDKDFYGENTFDYTVDDQSGAANARAIATVTVRVTAVNDAPVANNDSATTGPGEPVTIRVLDNDTDVDGDTLSVVAGSVTDPANGAAALKADGRTVTYTPAEGFHGQDRFTYEVSDGDVNTADDMATVTVTVGLGRVATAWLNRFGRTAAEQALAGIRDRLATPGRAGAEAKLAGHDLPSWSPGSDDGAFLPEGGRSGLAAAPVVPGTFPVTSPASAAASRSWGVSEQDLLAGSTLTLAGRTADGGLAGLWLRGAVSGFDGRDGSLALDGTVSTVQAGADYRRGPLTVGLSAAFSRGDGDWSGEGEGEAEAGMTGVYPYLGWRPDERVAFWAVAGYGQGTLKLKPEEGGGSIRTPFGLGLAAAGLRGQLVAPDPARDNFALAAVLDGLWVRTDPAKIGAAQSTRLRFGLEASWRVVQEDDAVLMPSLELAARHDGGDAETGTGVEVGGGIIYADPALGLSAELSGRALVSHAEDGYREWGAGGSVILDPGAGGLGLSLRLAPSWGTASGGAERLRAGGVGALGLAAEDRAANDNTAAMQLDTEVGYGLSALGDRGVLTPYGGLSLSDGGARDYRLGTRLEIGPSLDLSFEGTRREIDSAEAEHNVGFRLRANW